MAATTQSNAASSLDKYMAPLEQPVFVLDCKEAWKSLSDQEKRYAHHMAQGEFADIEGWLLTLRCLASWEGSLICLFQTSPESPALFSLLHSFFRSDSLDALRKVRA